MTLVREFNLYLNAGKSIPLVINVNQYDYGEQWVFTLYSDNGTQYTPSSGAIVGIKSDNLGIINTGTVDGQGRVVINETQQMTAAAGKAVFELMIDSQTHGTANFVVLVEKKPGDNADLSESDLSLIQQAIDSTSPTVIAESVSDWLDEHITNPTNPAIDTSLSVAGAAADAKATGDAISTLQSQIASGGGLNAEVKSALDQFTASVLQLAEKVAYIDENGQDYYDAIEDAADALHSAMYPPANLSSITAVYTQSGTVYDTDSLDSLKSDLVVTALYDNSTSEIVSTYTLSGTLAEGTSTITVSYGGKTTTFNVTVTNDPYLYELSAPVTMTGTQAVDTGVEFEEGQIITILADFTPTTLDATVRFVYTNKIGTETVYMGLQLQRTSYLWGMGRGYNAGNGVATANKRFRVAVVANTSTTDCTCTQYVRKVTDATTLASVSNQYTAMEGITNDSTIKIGNDTAGFIGTVHDFKIYDGEMASADITSWLEGA